MSFREHNALVVLGVIAAYVLLYILFSRAAAAVSQWHSERAAQFERAAQRSARRRTDSVATGAGFSQSVALGAAPRRQRGGPPPRARESRAYPPPREVPDEDQAA